MALLTPAVFWNKANIVNRMYPVVPVLLGLYLI